MKQIPNMFTLLNLLLGSMAIIFILQPGESFVNYNGEDWKVFLPERVWWGALCIFAAAVVDFLDGFLARLLKAEGEMGKQLDSLSDVVSFGVAPGMIMYQMLRIAYAYEPEGMETPIYTLMPALLIPLAAAWRLAKFNISTSTSKTFIGLPSPAAGLLVASFPLILLYSHVGIQQFLVNKWVLYVLSVLISYLMVSEIKMFSIKFNSLGWKENWKGYVLIIAGLVSALLFGWLAVPLVFIVYILLSLLSQKSML